MVVLLIAQFFMSQASAKRILEVVEEIVPISARLISNKSSFKFKNEMIEKIRAGLEQQVVEKND